MRNSMICDVLRAVSVSSGRNSISGLNSFSGPNSIIGLSSFSIQRRNTGEQQEELSAGLQDLALDLEDHALELLEYAEAPEAERRRLCQEVMMDKVVQTMRQHPDNDTIQACGCLALYGLLDASRHGTSSAAAALQQAQQAGAPSALLAAISAFPEGPVVAATLPAMSLLARGGVPELRNQLAQHAALPVLRVVGNFEWHPDGDTQVFGFQLLGAFLQAVHEESSLAGLSQELQQELPGQLASAMSHFAQHSTVQATLMEAAVPLLQLLLGPCSGSFECATQQCRQAGVLQALQAAVGAYCVRCEAEGKEPEEEVLQAPQHFKGML